MMNQFLQKTIYILIPCILFLTACNQSQSKNPSTKTDINVSFHIKSAGNKKVHLFKYSGNNISITDSTITNSKGYGSFNFTTSLQAGLYKLQLAPNSYVNLIINNEDIKFTTFIINSTDSMKVEQSEENKLYYQYLHEYKTLNKKLSLLYPVIRQYPQNEKFYNTLVNEFNTLQTEFIHNIEKLIAGKKDMFAAKYIKFTGYTVIDPLLTEEKQKEQLILNYFNHKGWTDTTFLYSDAYTNKINSYLSLYVNQTLPQNKQEELYKTAVDSIMKHTACNDKISDFVIKYITDLFEKQKMENVLVYIGEKYVGNISCVNEALKTELSKRIGKFEQVSIGKIAPGFKLPSIGGNEITFNNPEKPYTILLFWASWCPHCTDMLPKLKKYYDNQPNKNFEVFAISLDTSSQAWETLIKSTQLNWINCSDLMGWNGKVVKDYNVYATPTLFILDQNRKILSKPMTIEDVADFFNEHK